MDLPAALGAPRATQRNTPQVFAEQGFIDAYGRDWPRAATGWSSFPARRRA